ncbi:MAG: pyrimidine-nucleoside phosphorylase [Pseudoalteromonas tetraodonis]|jgi:pyrimidine-nucleoside phosphorylase
MHVPTIIEKKRDGGELSPEEISAVIVAFTCGELPDYQMSALAMAIYFQGMTAEETSHLTQSMLESGDVLSYPADSPPKVDKHSTGGVGDKVSLILAPLLACDEVWVPMISGRGLGITGGTLDKLESIPGFNVSLSENEAIAQLEKIGVVMIGQTGDICPADKKLYALRDVTATVPSQALIVASIMSKKLAESLDSLVLDVKFGSGAFMKTREQAESLAEAMRAVGEQMGVQTRYQLNPMEQPLGRCVGNALEVLESIETLRGKGSTDLVDLVLDLADEVASVDRSRLANWLEDGTAWEKFVQMVELQGGDAKALDKFAEVHPAPVQREFVAQSGGTITAVDALGVGQASLEMGAGRATADAEIDFAVGFSGIRKVGDEVDLDEPLLTIHARDEASADRAAEQLRLAISIK